MKLYEISEAQELGRLCAEFANEKNDDEYQKIEDKLDLILAGKSVFYRAEFQKYFRSSYSKHRIL